MTISQRSLAAAAMIYMALSVCLFLCGWFEAYISLPLSLGIATSIYIFFKKSANNANDEKWHISTSEGVQLVTIFLLIVFCLFKSGLAGVFATHSDYWIFRNGLYHNLIDAPWPVILPDGKEMSYYLSGLLVPAMLSRLTESYLLQQWILLIWSSIPIFLACLLCFCHHKKISWFFLISILFVDFDLLCKVPPINQILDASKSVCKNLLGDFSIPPYGRWIAWEMNLAALLAVSTPVLVCALFISIKKNIHEIIPLTTSMLAVISPMGAISIFPLALFYYLRSIKHSKPTLVQITSSLIIPITIAFFLAVYHLRSEGDIYIGFAHIAWGIPATLMYYLPAQILLTIIFVFLYKNYEDKSAIIVLFLTITLCPIFYIGSLPSKYFIGNNELWFKGSVAYIFLVGYYVASIWKKLPQIFRYCWVYWTAITIIFHTSWFALDPMVYRGGHKMKDILNGHLHHPQFAFLNQSCPPCKPPAIPGVMLRKSGESEQLFPGCILPKAPGCDYTRALNKE